MRQYSADSSVALRLELYDTGGELADADVSITITDPSGDPVTATVTRVDTGLYDAVVEGPDVDELGVWNFRWQTTGAVDYSASGQFYVSDPENDLPPLAPFSKLVRKLGYAPEGAERDRAEHLLNEASELIREKAEKTWTDDDGALTEIPRRIVLICVAVAFRAFGNPEGLTQRQIGDGSKSYDRTKREGGEDIYLTKAELDDVVRLGAATGSSFFSATMTSDLFGATLDPWVEATLQ